MKHMMNRIAFTILASLSAPSFSSAQSLDAWTKGFIDQGLFTAHIDTCDSSTEVFVQMGPSADLGFCMEKNQRTADKWEIARQTCSAVQKRLPEVGEYKYACKAGISGLANMTDNYEWSSNFPILTYGDSIANNLMVPVLGNGSCIIGGAGNIAHSSNVESTLAFRCVR